MSNDTGRGTRLQPMTIEHRSKVNVYITVSEAATHQDIGVIAWHTDALARRGYDVECHYNQKDNNA